MFRFGLLALALAIPVWSADPVVPAPQPLPPACLTAPVIQGSVTLSCTMIDNTMSNGEGLGPTMLAGNYIFQVRVSSIDPDVIGVRVGLTYQNQSQGVPITIWGSVGKSTGLFPQPGLLATPGFRYTFVLLNAPDVSGIQVQELKASSSQSF